MKLAEKVQCVCIAGIDPGDLFESPHCGIGFGERSIRHAEVVPGPRALRLTPRCIEENVARFCCPLDVQQSNAFIQMSREKRWVLRLGPPERLKRFGDARLVHIGDAEIVQTNSGSGSTRPLWGGGREHEGD